MAQSKDGPRKARSRRSAATRKPKQYPSASDTIPPAEAIKLWTASGGRCAFCNRYLLENEVTGDLTKIGEMAHIVGRSLSPQSPRGNEPLDVDLRNEADNLLLACPSEHVTIDSTTGRWVWEKVDLVAVKEEHEQRIHELTGLARERATTVVRVIGAIRAQVTSASKDVVHRAVHADLRFPQYGALRPVGSGVEVDLHANLDEYAEDYFERTGDLLAQRIGGLLAEEVASGTVDHVSVFAFARIPVLVQLGHHLDDKWPVELYDHHRDPEGWAWPDDSDPVQFVVERVSGDVDAAQVTSVLSLSGHVAPADLPSDCTVGAVYEMRPSGVEPVPGLVRSRGSLRNFSAAYAAWLSSVERDHPDAAAIDVVPAVGLSAGVELGRRRNRVANPPLRVWDRNATGGYDLATVVG